MHPILSDVRKLPWYMVAWLLTGILIATLLVMADQARWGNALIFAIPVAVVYGFVASSAYYVCRSLPIARRSSLPTMAAFGAASFLSGLTWLGLCHGWNAIGPTPVDAPRLIAIAPNLDIVLFVAGVVLYLLAILAHDVLIVIEDVHAAERREAESRVLARDAELQMLRMQINPHFLFNSLNSISALTAIDAPAARAMTIELAQFFRQSLALSERKLIPLADEMALCASFLAIEKIRFGKKLGTDLHIADDAQAALIPPMILQPLMENAVKHGIRDLVDGGVIAARAFARDNWLHITIENPVDPQPTGIAGNGLGLQNIRRRFASIYGEKARIAWTRTEERFLVEIVMPLDSGGPAEGQ